MSRQAAREVAGRGELLGWFDRQKRDLPWRRTRDPYAIWLSEVMLQQTQVSTVIPYWERFLARFPDVASLAKAPLDEVLSQWRGLGYYSRARNLHRAAQEILTRFDGALPASHDALLNLPGFGRYTAGAVASIAFELPAPIVDGNVARVFSRVHAIDGAPGDKAREKRLWDEAARWVQGERPGDLNQALMELGATVCKPVDPLCLLCPLRPGCRAHQEGRVHELPPAKVRAARKSLTIAACVWKDGDALLVGRRAGKGLFGGLWELPWVEVAPEDAAGGFARLLGVSLTSVEAIGTVKRTLTHRDLTIHLFAVRGKKSPRSAEGYDALQWASSADLAALGMSTAMSKAVALALETTTGAPARGSARPPRRGPRSPATP